MEKRLCSGQGRRPTAKINQFTRHVHLDLNAETSRDEVALLKEDGKQNDHDTEESHQENALVQVSLNALGVDVHKDVSDEVGDGRDNRDGPA
jgi:hypothetical protein